MVYIVTDCSILNLLKKPTSQRCGNQGTRWKTQKINIYLTLIQGLSREKFSLVTGDRNFLEEPYGFRITEKIYALATSRPLWFLSASVAAGMPFNPGRWSSVVSIPYVSLKGMYSVFCGFIVGSGNQWRLLIFSVESLAGFSVQYQQSAHFFTWKE